MRNFVQSRRLKALFALVFLSFVGVEVNAQDTVTVSYSHNFTRNQTYCIGDAPFDEWVTFLDSVENLQATGDYRFIEAKYNSTDGSNTKEHVFGGADIGAFITDLVSLDTITGSANYVSTGGDNWWITSGCEVSGSAAIGCATGIYPRIAVEINPVTGFGCNPNVESALRPVTGSSSWGGSFGATTPQSVSTTGPTETITFSVRYVDAAAPIPVCYTDTVDVYVNEFGGYALQVSDIDSASYDEYLNPTLPGTPTVGWGIETSTLSTTTVTCDSLGARSVLLTIVDSSGNDSTCVTIINVLDTINPTAMAADTTVYLDASGSVVIDPTFLNAGSFDNCNAGGFISVSDTLFDCTGVFADTLVMIDGSGNTDTAYAMVTVLDTIAPTANCITGPFEIYLDSNGLGVLVADSLNNGSTDNVSCSALTYSVDIDSFYCADAYTTDNTGPISVVLTVTDSSGNSSTCSTTVEVFDTIAPQPNLIDTLTIYVDGSGTATIDSASVDLSSSDACELSFLDIDILTVGCDSVDSTFYIYARLEDWYGNVSDEDSVLVNVLDTIAPVLDLNDTVWAFLDASGNYTLDSATVDNATADNCTGFTLGLGQTAFDCTEAGDTIPVLITATDLDNTPSVSTQNIYVVLRDTVSPMMTLTAVDTVYLDASGELAIDSNAFASATDACGILSITSTIDSVSCSDIASSPLSVTTTATDSNNNTTSGVTSLTVLDTLAPNVVLQNINVYLDASGSAVLDSNAFDLSSSDNCAIDSFALSLNTFGCSYINATNDSAVTVTTYAWDASNNMDSSTAIATIIDTIAPVVTCVDTVVYLDANGMAIIDSSYVIGSVVDNCPSTLTYSISQDTIQCADYDTVMITLSVTDAQGNVGTCVSSVAVMDTLAPVAMANNVTIYSDSMGIAKLDSQYVRDFVDNGSSDNCSFVLTVSDSIFDCSQEGLNLVTLTATDIAGNTGTVDFFVTVNDTIKPQAIGKDVTVALNDNGMVNIDPSLIDSASWDNCMDNMTFDLSKTNFDCSNLGANSVTFSVQDGNGQADSMTVVVTIIDKTLPTAIAQNIVAYLDASGETVITAGAVNNGSVDNCALDSMWLSKDTLTCDDLGVTPITLFVTDSNGNQNSATALVTVMDTIAPNVVVQNVTLYLDSAGNVPTINAAMFENGTTDNCGFTAELLNNVDYDCTHAGVNPVDIKYTDLGGNEVTVSATLTIIDSIAPTAVAQDIAVELDASGNVTITPAMVNNNSYDDCSELSYSLNITSFDCANIGANTVVLTVTDAANNSSTANAIVTVSDVTAPAISLNALTRSLDANGNVNVTAADFDNGTSDACGINTMAIDVDSFTCANIGLNTITFTATDSNGNVSTGTTTLTIVDDMNPTVVGQDFTAYLNADGNAIISVSDVNNGSSDNCEISLSINNANFDCTTTGANEVILTGVDGSGNTSADTVTVTVLDTVLPIAIAQNVIAELDETGVATITPEMVDNGSSDNCSGISLALSNTTYQCFLAGTNQIVSLEVTDASGNTSYASASVSIEDNIAPTVNIQPITRSLDASGTVTVTAADFNNGTTDNCAVNAMSIDLTTFDCSHVGNNTITFTAVDNSGNVSTGTTTLTIVDDEMPTAVTQDITVQLNAEGHAEITADMVDDGSSDNCDFTLSIDVTDFDCTDLGTNDVVLTVTDAHGNVSTSTAVVTVEDNITPTVSTRDTYEVTLDASGNATITAEELNLASSDNCASGDLTFHFSNGFDGTLSCSDIDDNGKNVYVFVKDAAGNISSTELTVVTIIDETAPVVVTNNVTRSLDASGNVTVTAADFDNGTSDACGIDVISVSPTSFDCSHVGVNTLTFTATDENGNTTSSNVYLTIEDNMAPTVVGQDITVSLDGSGNANISAQDVDNGTSDNCNFDIAINATDFDCSDLGANTVTLTATDVNGNTSSVNVTVTVEDNTNPTAIAQDITVELDASGNASITTGQINNGSLDNCSSQALTFMLSETAFDCTDIGANTVTLTATDASGNASTATATVTVVDNMNPVVSSQNIALTLDASGNKSIDVPAFVHGATDNCGIASFTLSNTDFDCTNIGLNTIELEVTDNNGNVSTADVFVTVTDETKPDFVVGSYVVDTTLGVCNAAGYTYDEPAFTDNCGVASVALVSGLPSGAIFPVGTTTITYLATDASGNSRSVSMFVTVEEQGMPTNLPESAEMCLDGDNISLGNGATFTGSGVSGNEFNPSAAGAGTHVLTWTFTDSYGCETSGTVTMIVYPTPTLPVVTQTSSTTLTASGNGYDTYKWFKNGVELTNETAQTLSIYSAGNYQVEGYTINGCSGLSIPLNIGGGNFEFETKYDIAETTLYPNPTTGKVYVDLGETLETVSIEIFDARGAKVKTFNFENMTSSTVEIELNELPSAMYQVVISSDVQVTTKKIVINK